MKINFIFAWIGFLLFMAILPSCNKDDDAFYETSTAINSFAFDSVRDAYGEKVKNSDYPFTIDLTWKTDTALIYNKDSLPYRSNLSRTLISVTSPATIYRLTQEGYALFQNRLDTLDCNRPIILKAVGADAYGNATEKIYKITFNVHQVNPDSVPWKTYSPTINFEGKQKSLIFQGHLFLFMENGNIYSTSLSDGTQWTRTASNPAFDYTSATVFAGRIYIVANGNVYASSNGTDWEIQPLLSTDSNVETLLGATDLYLSGIKNGKYCTTTGTDWEIGGSANGFQRTYPSSVTYKLSTNEHIQQVAVLGLSDGNSIAHSLLVAEENLLNWSHWGPVDSVFYQLPNEPRMALIRYRGDKFYSFGGSSSNSFKDYYTSDGLYWTHHTNHTFFPEEFSYRGEFSVVVDPENYIWIIFSQSTGGNAVIYKGRFNSYNF